MHIYNKKILSLLQQKDDLVKEGRGVSKKIEKLDAKIKVCEDQEKAITLKIEPKELGEKAEKLKAEINELIKKFEKVASDITLEKMNGIPKDLEKKHRDFLADKEKLERERNKIALKVQKVKDRVVPLIKKEIEPQLKEYEDIETAVVKGGLVEVTTFSHLEEFKAQFKAKNKK
jgi:predicted  nucleic acid-binding Zn-ribbon protein